MVEGYEIIDCHMHPGFKNSFDAVGSEDIFIDDLKRAGIDKICGSVVKCPAFEADWSDVEECNDSAMEFYKRYPDFYTPGILVHGSYVEESCREIEKRYAEFGCGADGIGYVHEGNTYPVKDQIRKNGGRWIYGVWVCPVEIKGDGIRIHSIDLKGHIGGGSEMWVDDFDLYEAIRR